MYNAILEKFNTSFDTIFVFSFKFRILLSETIIENKD